MISSVADQVIAFEVKNPDKAAIFTEHCLFIFILFYSGQYLVRGAQFSVAGLNGARMKRKTTQEMMIDKK